jgi:hypothetical protein
MVLTTLVKCNSQMVVIFYVWATMGTRLFGAAPLTPDGDLNPSNHFRTFFSTMKILFQITCGQQYTGILAELLDAEAGYVDDSGNPIPLELQQTELSIFCYFASFIFMSVFVGSNLFIVSVLDSFDYQTKTDQIITRDDLWGFT